MWTRRPRRRIQKRSIRGPGVTGEAADQQKCPLAQIGRQRVPKAQIQRDEYRYEAADPGITCRASANRGCLRAVPDVRNNPAGVAVAAAVKNFNEMWKARLRRVFGKVVQRNIIARRQIAAATIVVGDVPVVEQPCHARRECKLRRAQKPPQNRITPAGRSNSGVMAQDAGRTKCKGYSATFTVIVEQRPSMVLWRS